MRENGSPSVRSLYAWEIQEARQVFDTILHYERVRVHECHKLPNIINRLGMWLKGLPYIEMDNAITLGFHCYFPVKLVEEPVGPDHPKFSTIPWLIHELTHTWQYQRLGWSYLYKSLKAQFSLGAQAYDYGGEGGLFDCHQQGNTLNYFNLEQQGDITRDYYYRLRMGEDVSAWLPFIVEIQQMLD